MSVNASLHDDFLEEKEVEDTQEDKFLTFFLGDGEYGIEIRHVTEIIGIQNITDVPDMPSYVKGVINLRGKVVPVLDVRLRFGMEERGYDDRTCIVVINIDSHAVGLIVDRVSEVLDIPKNDVEVPPKVKKGEGSRFVKGIGKLGDNVKILLDAPSLLFEKEESVYEMVL
ncbi:MAG: chemotaxis protein CheW [Bacillota bacterium]